MPTAILGISAFYHDSAAAIIIDGEVEAAAQEERFTRNRHDASFPVNAVTFVLQEAGMNYNELTAVAFYDKPLLKFERLLETYHAFVPRGLASFSKAIPAWIKEKLFFKKHLRDHLKAFGKQEIPFLFPEHHLSHAASAFYPSPFEEAAILTIDGVGEWATTAISHGTGNQVKVLKELHFPHSVGLLYSAFTYFLGFRVNSGEYKLMGLAPYGNSKAEQTAGFRDQIMRELVDIREDGSILLNMQYFDFATSLTMTNDAKWKKLFGFGRREPESEILQQHMNLALALQEVTERIVLLLAVTAQRITNSKNLVMAGGVALNCVANSKIAQTGIFDQMWIQPAAGDAGGALGAALAAYHIGYNRQRKQPPQQDLMKNAYLGPQYSASDIRSLIRKYDIIYEYVADFGELTGIVSRKIAEKKIVGWFQDRMEFGPRALGNRSILADPRDPDMQKKINLKIKFREGFRPFAPSILMEDLSRYFHMSSASPYMLFVASLKEQWRKAEPDNYMDLGLHGRLGHIRADIPSVIHVDYTARIQTVSKAANPKFWQLITAFKKLTGCGMLINTSFNVRGEPIVCTPEQAYQCLMNTEMDLLVLGNFLIERVNQKPLPDDAGVRAFSPD